MSTHPGMLLAYDADGNVLATLDYLIQYSADLARRPLGLVDFAGHEEAGSEAREIWVHDSGDPTHPVKGSKVWPEYLGSRAHEFTVELAGPAGAKRISALVHKTSGYRRVRANVEAAIAGRIKAANGGPADIRDLVGGPDRPLPLKEDGSTGTWAPPAPPPALPLLNVGGSASA